MSRNKRLFSSEKQDLKTVRDSKSTSIEADQSIVLPDYSDLDSLDDPQSLTDRLNLHSISESLAEIQQTRIQDPELPNSELSLSLKYQINDSNDPYDGSQSEHDSEYARALYALAYSYNYHTQGYVYVYTTPLLEKRNNFQRILATELLSKHKDNRTASTPAVSAKSKRRLNDTIANRIRSPDISIIAKAPNKIQNSSSDDDTRVITV